MTHQNLQPDEYVVCFDGCKHDPHIHVGETLLEHWPLCTPDAKSEASRTYTKGVENLPTIELTLDGVVPSKKNGYRRRGNGAGMYIPEQMRADIDALVIQAQAARHKLDLESIEGRKVHVHLQFTVPDERKDLDNMHTTVLDVLQTAGIIKNDRLVRSFTVEELCNAHRAPFVRILITPR